MPILLTTPRVDPTTGTECPLAMASEIFVNTVGDRYLRFKIMFGYAEDGAFRAVADGGTFAVRNVPERSESGIDPADGEFKVVEVPAVMEFDQLYAAAVSAKKGEFAWDIVGDRAIYPWLIANHPTYEGEIV